MKKFTSIRLTFLLFFMGMGLVFLLGSFSYPVFPLNPYGNGIKWTIMPNSFLTINGSSNVNRFGCETDGAFQAETLWGTPSQQGKTIHMEGAVTVAINQFDCNNKMLTNDLRKTLKAKEYPEMVIRFVSLERMPVSDGKEDFVSGKVTIELAGQQKPFELMYSFIKTTSGYKLQGGRTFSFTDFDLSPPKKIGGLIKVKDHFEVTFTLLLLEAN